jgi:copper chaperone CopZ
MNFIKVIVLGLLMSHGLNAISQSKYEEINFRVEGNCGMCESRIEKALDVKGIKLGDWTLASKNCRVIYKTSLYTEREIHQIIADLGHSTALIKTTDEAYDKLHGCCKW